MKSTSSFFTSGPLLNSNASRAFCAFLASSRSIRRLSTSSTAFSSLSEWFSLASYGFS